MLQEPPGIMVLPWNLGQMGCGCQAQAIWPWPSRWRLPSFPQVCLGLATPRWVQVLV